MPLLLPAVVLPGILLLLAVPLVLGKVPPNRLYGFRTAKTLSSPGIWYAANRFSGWCLIAAFTLTIVFNLILWQIRPDWPTEKLAIWMSGIMLGWLLLAAARSFVYLSRL